MVVARRLGAARRAEATAIAPTQHAASARQAAAQRREAGGVKKLYRQRKRACPSCRAARPPPGPWGP
jgi:hypothetical protein